MEKYVIEKNSVQETLIIPLFGRSAAMELYPDLFSDKECMELLSRIEYEVEKMPKIKIKIGAILAATRQYDLAHVCREYMKEHPEASVINLGCGLDTTFYQLGNGRAKGYNIDFQDVIDVRNELLPPKAGEVNIGSDLTDTSWFEKIDFTPEKGAVFFASGVFYYIKKEEIKNLFIKMAEHFPGAKIVFDATTAKGLKKMLKAWLKSADMKDVGLFFSVEDEKELSGWTKKFSNVVRKGYMTGYRALDKRYGFLANMLFRYTDRKRLSQIIEIEFAREG